MDKENKTITIQGDFKGTAIDPDGMKIENPVIVQDVMGKQIGTAIVERKQKYDFDAIITLDPSSNFSKMFEKTNLKDYSTCSVVGEILDSDENIVKEFKLTGVTLSPKLDQP